MLRSIKGLLCFVYILFAACATNHTGINEEFDRSVKAYNRLLRWHEMEDAGMTFIDSGLREEYIKQAAILKKRGLSVTDFRILSSRCIPDKKTGDVVAEFDYYILPSNRVKTVSYRQEWVYLETLKRWKVKSGLPVFE